MKRSHFLRRMVSVQLTSADLGTVLNAILEAKIEIQQLKQHNELTCDFWVPQSGYPALERICTQQGSTLKTVRRRGMYLSGKGLMSRKILCLASVLFFFIWMYVPQRIFFVQVEGAAAVSPGRILNAAEFCGVDFGASRRTVRSEKVKNALLEAIPELQWAGINTKGCTAIISVRERETAQNAQTEGMVSHIVAARDGFILSGTVTQGSGMFSPGQSVQEGDVLISGYTDCGLTIQATRAQGEIVGQTRRSVDAVMLSNSHVRDTVTETKRKISLILQKKRINLWKDSGISDTSCGRMYEEYYFTLPGGFVLPIALCVETYFMYETRDALLSETDAREKLASFADRYLRSQMISGTILDYSHTIHSGNGVYQLTGIYECTEMIGKEQLQQIGEING